MRRAGIYGCLPDASRNRELGIDFLRQISLDYKVSAELISKLYKSFRDTTENLNCLKRNYAYEEGQREGINNQSRTRKTWFDIICARNHIVPADKELIIGKF